jgi:hypothetical protein
MMAQITIIYLHATPKRRIPSSHQHLHRPFFSSPYEEVVMLARIGDFE